MFSIPRQQQYIILLLVGAMLFGGSVLFWRQHQVQPVVVEGPMSIEEEGETAAEPREVVVHIAGAVVNSGVYRLPEGSRVIDALEAAGGGTPDADLDALNLAEVLVDGRRYYVPTVEETAAGANPSRVAPAKININLATQAELETLPGIGPALASRIIAYRETNGPFRRIEDVKRVPGIGDKRFEELKDLITAP